jgi:hypothetical protein
MDLTLFCFSMDVCIMQQVVIYEAGSLAAPVGQHKMLFLCPASQL